MTRTLIAASLAALILVSPVIAVAQSDDAGTSSYSDTMPRKVRTHASTHKAHKSHKSHKKAHRSHKAHSTHKSHKTKVHKRKKAS